MPTTRKMLRDKLKSISPKEMIRSSSVWSEWMFIKDAVEKYNVSHTAILNWINQSIENPKSSKVEARTIKLTEDSQPGAIVVRFKL